MPARPAPRRPPIIEPCEQSLLSMFWFEGLTSFVEELEIFLQGTSTVSFQLLTYPGFTRVPGIYSSQYSVRIQVLDVEYPA